MAHTEPMDLDGIESDFDNKENTYHINNAFPRASCEKENENPDISEVKSKLRYSITQESCAMSKSFTANYADGNNISSVEDHNMMNINSNLTRSLNSTLNNSDSIIKSPKSLPLQSISDQYTDMDRHTTVRHSFDASKMNKTEMDRLSLPSTTSSLAHTPEATTPTKEIPKVDGGSPIMRGLKSVLSMFRSSNNPIPQLEVNKLEEQEAISSQIESVPQTPAVIASTPVRNNNIKGIISVKESIVFQDDLERELQWKDDPDVFFKEEKVPVHILFPCLTSSNVKSAKSNLLQDNGNISVENIDISLNDTVTGCTDHQTTEINLSNHESDSEFVDCESTFNNSATYTNNELQHQEHANISVVEYDIEVISSATEQNQLLPLKPKLTELIEPKNVSIFNSAHVNVSKISDEKQDVAITEDAISKRPDLCSEQKHTINANQTNDETINIETARDKNIDTKFDLNVETEENFSANIIIENRPLNVNRETENLNKTTYTQKDIKEYLVSEKVENVNETINIDAIIENTSQNITLNNDKSISLNVPVNIQTYLDTENDLKAEMVEKLNKTIGIEQSVENRTINVNCDSAAVVLNETIDIEMHLEAENVLNTEMEEKLNATMNIDSNFNSNLTTTYAIELDQPDSFQLKVDEAPTEQINSFDSKNQIPNSKKPNDTIFTDFSELTTEMVKKINHEEESELKSKLLNQISVLPDVVQISQDDKKSEIICLKENEISNHKDDSLGLCQSDIVCVNLSKMEEDTTISHDATAATESDMLHDININMKDTTTINAVLSNNINKVKIVEQNYLVNDAIHQFDQANNTKSINETSWCQNENPAAVESSIISEKDDMKLNKNDIDLYYGTQSTVQSSFSETSENITERNILNISEGNVCLKSNILMKYKNTLAQDESDLNLNNEDNELNTLIKQENYKTSAQLLNAVDEESSIQVGNEEVIQNHIDIINTDDKNKLDSIQLISNLTDSCKDLKSSDSKIEIKDISSKTCKEDLIDQDCPENVVEIQTNIYETNELDKNDLEVENINKLASEIVDTYVKTKSRLLETPTSPKITRGNNFNFDEIENPFATKTKMRSSPPLRKALSDNLITVEGHNKSCNRLKMLPNRRKSQPTPKKQNVVFKKKMNSTFNETVLIDESNNLELNESSKLNEHQQNENSLKDDFKLKMEVKRHNETQILTENNAKQSQDVTDDESISDPNVPHNSNKNNVFNSPETDDNFFNPFATKIKVCSTPSLINNNIQADDDDPFDSNKNNASVIVNTKINEEISDECNDSISSSLIDKTLKEVNTEDEDTIEGPFLEGLGKTEKNDMLLNDEKHVYVAFDNDEKHDYMAFDDFPKQQTDEAENEMFIDAEAFEFFLNQNQTNVVADSGKESLFLKFDPLFAKRISSDGILAALSNIQNNQCTQIKEKQPESHLYTENTNSIPSCSKSIPLFDNIDESNTNNLIKPTMVVNPAVVSLRKSSTPNKINRQSLTFTSPAMAVIDRLLSLSGNTSSTSCHDTSLPQSWSEQNHTDIALTQLREMLAEKEMHVHVLRNERKELTSRLGMLESQVKTLEYESEVRIRKIKDLNNQISEKNKQNKNMATVVEEYERTIATLVSELQQDKKRYAEERMKIIKDRDEQTAHLASMEISFNDLHSKYEKSKLIILSLKANEDCLKKSLQDFEDNELKIQNNYELLKQHATSQLNHANKELEKINKTHEAEVLKLKAMMKRKDLHISSLEETLAQKTKANEELTAICDELINKVG